MGGERERDWRAFADLGCVVGGGAVMFWIAARVDLLPRLLGSSTATDPVALRRAVLLLAIITLALGLFGYRRWREASRSRAATVRWAHRDPITGVADRTVAQVRLQRALQVAPEGVAVIVVDLDGFKTVNESYGHDAGDRLLAAVAQRLQGAVGAGHLLARLESDAFVVVCEDGVEAVRIGDRLNESLVPSFVVEGEEVWLTAGIGVAVADSGADSPSTLLRDADAALGCAKAAGRGQQFVLDRSMRAARTTKDEIVQRLRFALRRGEFRLAYQPVVSAADEQLVGVEALLRWDGPAGMVAPERFVPLLEETGLIVPVGTWVLEEACRQAARWQRAGADLTVACNVSPRQLAQPDFASVVRKAVAAAGADPGRLCIEITEEALIEDLEVVRRELARIRGVGVRVAVDDFGTGYSSVSYVRALALDSLKIDKSFVKGVTAGAEDAAIAHAVIKMAHALGLSTVAEGVETVDELRRLQALGCDFVQGFYFAAALPAAAIDDLLARRDAEALLA